MFSDRLQNARRFVQTTLSPESLEPDVETPDVPYPRTRRSRYSFEDWSSGTNFTRGEGYSTESSTDAPPPAALSGTADSYQRYYDSMGKSGIRSANMKGRRRRGTRSTHQDQEHLIWDLHDTQHSNKYPPQPSTSSSEKSSRRKRLDTSQLSESINTQRLHEKRSHGPSHGDDGVANTTNGSPITPAQSWSNGELEQASRALQELREQAAAQLLSSESRRRHGSQLRTSEQRAKGSADNTPSASKVRCFVCLLVYIRNVIRRNRCISTPNAGCRKTL